VAQARRSIAEKGISLSPFLSPNVYRVLQMQDGSIPSLSMDKEGQGRGISFKVHQAAVQVSYSSWIQTPTILQA